MLKNRKIIAIITIFILATWITYWYGQAKEQNDIFEMMQSVLFPENDKYIEELEMKLFHAEMELSRKNKAIEIFKKRCPDAMDLYLDFFVN